MRALKIFFIVFVLLAGFGLFSQYAEAQKTVAPYRGGSNGSYHGGSRGSYHGGYRGGYHGYRGGYGYGYRGYGYRGYVLDITLHTITVPIGDFMGMAGVTLITVMVTATVIHTIPAITMVTVKSNWM